MFTDATYLDTSGDKSSTRNFGIDGHTVPASVTANLDLGREFRPPFGVYATLAVLDGRAYGSVSNVGYRPTISPTEPGAKPDLLVETHLFDFDGDLYGDVLRVRFLHRIRDERKFNGIDELKAQIERDICRALNYFRYPGVRNMLEIL